MTMDEAFQTNWFIVSGEKIAEMHRNNLGPRKIVLGALRALAGQVIEGQIDEYQSSPVLEVGCGDNFFRDWLASEWLRCRLIGFDINLHSLQAARRRNSQAKLFLADVNDLNCVASESFTAAIGWSSFDSFPNLNKALKQVARLLIPGGPLLLIQDATAVLHTPLFGNPDSASVERYHLALERALMNCQEFDLESSGDAEMLVIEPRELVIDRMGNHSFYPRIARQALVVGSDRGEFIGCEKVSLLEKFKERYQIEINLNELIDAGKIVEWVRTKVVRARKK